MRTCSAERNIYTLHALDQQKLSCVQRLQGDGDGDAGKTNIYTSRHKDAYAYSHIYTETYIETYTHTPIQIHTPMHMHEQSSVQVHVRESTPCISGSHVRIKTMRSACEARF